MKAARLIVLGVALAAGGFAAYLAAGSDRLAPAAAGLAPQLMTVEVLVAKNEIGIGQTVLAQDLQWQPWPAASAGNFIKRSERPEAAGELAGAIARAPMAEGEPVRETRLIKANGSGYMAAILPSGMRAISTEISPETGAGGFILPNDHVDVILSRRDTERTSTGEVFVSETILSDVRVLAIDQTVEEKGGQKVVVGKTATLELTQRQAETLARSRQQGTLSLALRSIADANKNAHAENSGEAGSGRVNLIRFGVTTSTLAK